MLVDFRIELLKSVCLLRCFLHAKQVVALFVVHGLSVWFKYLKILVVRLLCIFVSETERSCVYSIVIFSLDYDNVMIVAAQTNSPKFRPIN